MSNTWYRRWLRRLGALVATLLVGGAVGVALLQLPAIQRWLLQELVELLNRELRTGRLSIAAVHFRGLSGLELRELLVQEATGDTVIFVPSALLTYEVFALTHRRIVIPTLVLERPLIRLVRGRDSLWNIERIVGSDTRAGQPPDVSIWLRGIHAHRSTIFLVDSLAPIVDGLLGQGQWRLHEVDFLLSAALFPRQHRVHLTVRRLRFHELLSGMTVEHCRGSITLTPSSLRLERCQLRTPGMGLRLELYDHIPQASAHVSPDSVLRFGQLEGILQVDSLELSRMAYHFPQLPRLPGTLSAVVHFRGNLQQLQLPSLTAHLGKAHAQLRAVQITPAAGVPHMRGVIESATIPSELLHSLAPELPPQAQQLGSIRLGNLHFTLSSTELEASGNMHTRLGQLSLRVQLRHWDTPRPLYALFLSTPMFNLSQLFPELVLPVAIGGTFQFEGSGQRLEQADVRARATLTGGYIGGISIQTAHLSSRLTDGFLQIDTAYGRLLSAADTATVHLLGWFRFTPPTLPSYRLELTLLHFPLAALLRDTALPELLSLRAHVAGKGLHPDSLEGFLQARVEQLQYPEWALFPFELMLHLSRPSLSTRFLQLRGDLFAIQLSGHWHLSTLPTLLESLGHATAQWLAEQHGGSATTAPQPIPLPDSADIHFTLELGDMAWLKRWTYPLQLQGSFSLAGRLTARTDTTFLLLERCRARFLQLTTEGVSIRSNWLRLDSTAMGFHLSRAYPMLASLSGMLSALSLQVGAQTLDTLQLRWVLDERAGQLKLRVARQEFLAASASAFLRRTPGQYDVRVDSLHLEHFPSGFAWRTPSPARLRLKAATLMLDTLRLERRGSEQVQLHGAIAGDSLSTLRAELYHMALSDLWRLLPPEYQRPEFIPLVGRLDTVTVVLSGPWQALRGELALSLKHLSYDTTYLGDLSITAAATPELLSGSAALEAGSHRLRVQLSSFPLQEELYTRIPVSASIEASRLNAALFIPLVPELRQLRGLFQAAVTLHGYLPSEFTATGTIRSDSLAFQTGFTGISYTATFSLRIDRQRLTIERFVLRNVPEEFAQGSALVTGTIGFRQLRPWTLDLQCRSSRILVLNYSSARARTPIYGPLVLATGEPPLQLTGTWEHPHVQGTLLVQTARLFLPAESWIPPPSTSLLADYHWRTNPGVSPQTEATSAQTGPSPLRSEPNLAERLFYDLRIYLLGPASITMDLAPTQQLYADLEAENPTIPLAYVTGPEGTPQLLGRLRLRPGSVYKFYRNFTATGTISFTTGEIDNPELDIEVRYQGFRLFNNQRQSYEVRFTLRGTRRNLSIGNWSYTIAGTAGTGDESKLFSDVLWLLLVGRTQEELEGSWSANGGIGREIPLANLSTLASKAATELFRGLGLIHDVQIDPTTGTFDLEQMRARITGQLGGITLRWGGLLTSPLQQAEFTVEMPLSELLRGEPGFLQRVLLQLSTTTGSTTVALPSAQRLWEVRISVRL